jgi:hypothetical protein
MWTRRHVDPEASRSLLEFKIKCTTQAVAEEIGQVCRPSLAQYSEECNGKVRVCLARPSLISIDHVSNVQVRRPRKLMCDGCHSHFLLFHLPSVVLLRTIVSLMQSAYGVHKSLHKSIHNYNCKLFTQYAWATLHAQPNTSILSKVAASLVRRILVLDIERPCFLARVKVRHTNKLTLGRHLWKKMQGVREKWSDSITWASSEHQTYYIAVENHGPTRQVRATAVAKNTAI